MADCAHILCIEDDPGTAELLVEELTEAGFDTKVASDGPAGISAIANRPDLILCDIDLPVLSGFDILEHVRALGDPFHRVPFIFLTAYGQRENQIRARRLGCDDYVTKPIDFELLVEIIRSRLGRSNDQRIAAAGVQLTDRETETLTWSARGKSSADIAMLMKLSERTVNFHIENAIRKLGVATRIQAAVTAALMGLIEP